jgi:hypothetical protein
VTHAILCGPKGLAMSPTKANLAKESLRAQAQTLSDWICGSLGAPPCRVEWKDNQVCDTYRGGTVFLAKLDTTMMVDRMLHELAHHIQTIRQLGTRHDLAYVDCLAELARLWYGDTSQYDWESDYTIVHTIARKRGYM